jgi:REP element-mobilizing transposase RayT
VTQRGNRREPVFFTDEDRRAYLDWLGEYAGKNEVEVLAYCLMTNHIHLSTKRGRIYFQDRKEGCREKRLPLWVW